jgi:SAM-dependent methyltransferase
MTRRGLALSLAAALAASGCASRQASADVSPSTASGRAEGVGGGTPDVPYVPTPPEVVDAMLKMASVRDGDVVYDLGCGDGRIVIQAASRHAVRGVGIDIDPDRIAEATQNATDAGVTDRVQFRNENLFEADLSDASVVTLYLLSSVNLRLRPKLLSELKPGTRIVSHAFDMGEWRPERTEEIDGRQIFFWRVPEDPQALLAELQRREGAAGGR